MTEVEVAWLAGLLEGEATFGWKNSWWPTGYGYPFIRLAMTDEDVVRSAAMLSEATSVRKYAGQCANCKFVYSWDVYGRKAANLMRAIFPHMGRRRSLRIADLLLRWDRRPGIRRRVKKVEA